ncbi:hypothetical protein [Streptomyces sp. 6N106]|uniref:hypothetical protein n=1 Tax=Streptomyces sp. 6N106 TaxID=3457418 RepID=UPI003FD33758
MATAAAWAVAITPLNDWPGDVAWSRQLVIDTVGRTGAPGRGAEASEPSSRRDP